MEEFRDDQLLQHWVEKGSQWAFAEIGRRYAGLVFSVCLRELGDSMLAEDASQAVFLLLAQKAPKLRKEGALAGWLFQTARLVSQSARRQEQRRRVRETRAAQIMTIERESKHEADALWNEIAPHLNTALARLKPAEREAILLRCFQGRSLAETGLALGVTENTARMRVSRAAEKLRVLLAKARLAVSTAALIALISERASQATPTTLLDALDSIATGSAGAGLTTFTTSNVIASKTASGTAQTSRVHLFAKGATVVMAISTVKMIAAGTVMAALLGLGGVALHNKTRPRSALAQLPAANNIEVVVVPETQLKAVYKVLERLHVGQYSVAQFRRSNLRHISVPPRRADRIREALAQSGIVSAPVPTEERVLMDRITEMRRKMRR